MAKTISCVLNKNLTKADACGYSLKQIVEIYLAEFAEASAITMSSDEYSVSAVSEDLTWYKIEPAKDTASYNDDLVVGGNGSKYRTHQLSFSFNAPYDVDMAKALDALSLGKFVAVLKLSDGSRIMLGRLVGLEATAASSLSEAAADGQNGITVTMEANCTESAVSVPESVTLNIAD